MKISHKLVGSFIGISLLTGFVGAVAIAQGQKIAETLTISEAKNLAQSIATSIATDDNKFGALTGIKTSTTLQKYIFQMHKLQNRDIEVVNRQKQILADAIPSDIGTVLEPGQGEIVEQTMQDGVIRTLEEKSSDYPQGIKLIAVPLKVNSDHIVGAVILEWSSLYNSATAEARPTLFVIGITSLGCVILALLIGLQISNSIANPLKAVTDVAEKVTQASNFDLQAPVQAHDETGTLATALNKLIQQVKTLLNEKEERAEALNHALNQLHKTHLQLMQTEKMSSLGQLVAGVAHEINNPVNFIHGNIEYIDNYAQDLLGVVQAYQSHYPNPPVTLQETLEDAELDFLNQDFRKLLQSIKVGTDRIRQIVLSLRNFSRVDESEFKAVDIHEGIENTLMILQHRLKVGPDSPAITVVKEYGALPLVECYPGQLNQVFMNILANAIDALQESAVQPSTIVLSTQRMAQDRVEITIADNGPGMPKTVCSRIFDPFFTTKPVGKGTGIGLSISYQIVAEKHNGKIWCDSTPGEGTKFVIDIPIYQPEAQRT